MKNTIKALSKQFFGAKYESARKSLLAAAILFIAIYAAEIRVAVAPAILYLTSTLFTAGVMWQVLTGRRQMEAMQGMLMLPFDNRGFVFGYVLALGAHTLVTKTLLVWALFMSLFARRAGQFLLIWTLAVLFMLPRLVAGAHWGQDDYIGGLQMALLALAWGCYTPLAAKASGWLVQVTEPLFRLLAKLPLIGRLGVVRDSA